MRYGWKELVTSEWMIERVDGGNDGIRGAVLYPDEATYVLTWSCTRGPPLVLDVAWPDVSCDMSGTSDVIRLKYSKISMDVGHAMTEKKLGSMRWHLTIRALSIG